MLVSPPSLHWSPLREPFPVPFELCFLRPDQIVQVECDKVSVLVKYIVRVQELKVQSLAN